jgi:hypothetical protein
MIPSSRLPPLPGCCSGVRGPLARTSRRLLALQSARRLVPCRLGDIVVTGRLRRLFWRVADNLDYLVTLTRLRVLDAIVVPLPETPADQQREQDRERLRKAFPEIEP